MAKAILVIDMPSSCSKCSLSKLYGSYCSATQSDTWAIEGDISEDCPLKPLGKRVEEYELETWTTRDGIFLCEKGLFDELYGGDEKDE